MPTASSTRCVCARACRCDLCECVCSYERACSCTCRRGFFPPFLSLSLLRVRAVAVAVLPLMTLTPLTVYALVARCTCASSASSFSRTSPSTCGTATSASCGYGGPTRFCFRASAGVPCKLDADDVAGVCSTRLVMRSIARTASQCSRSTEASRRFTARCVVTARAWHTHEVALQ
jgi:hypothetical protein